MSLQIEYIPTSELNPYKNNARKHENTDVSAIVSSIQEFGFDDPIGVWGEDNTIIEGHGRLMAAKKLKIKEVPCIRLDHLTDEQRRAYALAHNKTAELSEWDDELLKIELDDILNIDMSEFGFDLDLTTWEDTGVAGSIKDDYIIPPFSVLNTRDGDWQERKKAWKALGLTSGDGREEDLLSLNKAVKRSGREGNITGTSIFDPVLCEIMYKWFNVDNGSIYDCFAGGAVRGIVAGYLGYQYTGIDLRQEQITANQDVLQNIDPDNIKINPVWVCDDSNNADLYIQDESVDMLLTCPPYGDLEVYSDDPRDISNKNYDEFLTLYESILNKAINKLRQNRFAVIVVGDIRDKKGNYRGFTDDTKRIFRNAGMELYNEFILVEMLGTAPVRVRNTFNNARKAVKCHQNVLVFYKGDVKQIKQNFRDILKDDDIMDRMEKALA